LPLNRETTTTQCNTQAEDAGSTVDFTLSFDGGKPISKSGMVTKNGTVLVTAVEVPGATLWTPESPTLHTVTVTFRGGENG
jgi:beta-galactosidase/beta-glucuronidase